MSKKIKMSIAAIMSCALLMGATSISAATTRTPSHHVDWSIHYIPGAPSSMSNQVHTTNLIPYYSNGYYANCSTISGDNGRSLHISSSYAGGMNYVYITQTGKTRGWEMKDSSKDSIRFNVTAESGYRCNSTGTIYTDN